MGLMVLESKAQTAARPAQSKQERPMPTPEEQAQKQTDRATREFGLTTDQQSKFKAFALERINTVQPIREKMKTTTDKAERQKMHGEMKAANDKFDQNVKGILTAEQLPKWEARKEQHMEKRKEHMEQRRENQEGNK